MTKVFVLSTPTGEIAIRADRIDAIKLHGTEHGRYHDVHVIANGMTYAQYHTSAEAASAAYEEMLAELGWEK